jgi:microsomal dipeptidase-like Zn-dependent dipeptidase
MRRLGRQLVVVVLALAATIAFFGPAPARADEPSRYSFADQCVTLRAPTGAVGRSGLGYAAGAAPTPFSLKATALGSYMLYGADRTLIAAAPLGAVVASAKPGPAADWELQPASDGWTLSNHASGRSLGVDPGGRLVQANDGGAVFSLPAAQGCAAFPEIGLGARGAPWSGTTPYEEVVGTVDGHNHVTAYEFLGGDAHCGEPWSRYGVTVALVDCPDHYPDGSGAVLENALYGDPLRKHDPVGWPTFRDWPAPASQTHEQTYYRWLQRAYLGGVRIMVNDLVENVALCQVYPIKHNSCDDTESVRLQYRRIRELEEYVDAQSGGPGKGWLRIVRDPFAARRVLSEGKMAVVLGIETSEIFGCGGSEEAPRCGRQQILAGLDEIERMGVASFFPIHKFDNALGGVRFDSGAFGAAINAANFKQTGHFWEIETCRGEREDNAQDTALPGEADVIDAGLFSFLPPGAVPLYPPPPHCNVLGLTPLGEFAVEQMIDRGLMVEVDHMSQRSASRALELAEARGYSGVLSSHSWMDPHLRSRVYALGGFIEPITTGPESFIEEWRQLRAVADPRFRFGIGFGADANGFHAQPPARGSGAPGPVTYPFQSLDGRVTFERQLSGQRRYDVNVDGVAHYGLYPDWMEQLRLLAGQPIADDLMGGAEAYLQTWERAVGVPGPGCLAPPRRLGRSGFGPLRLGRRPRQILLAAGQPSRRRGRAFSWCAARGKAKGARRGGVAVLFGASGKAVLIASTAAAKAKPERAQKLGHGLFVVRRGRGGDRVWGYRNGKLRFTAVATVSLADRAGRLRSALRATGLG